jgi:hypothetical protein
VRPAAPGRTTARRAGSATAVWAGSNVTSITGGGGSRLGSSTRIPASACHADRCIKTASVSATQARSAKLGRLKINGIEDTVGRIRYADRPLLIEEQEPRCDG